MLPRCSYEYIMTCIRVCKEKLVRNCFFPFSPPATAWICLLKSKKKKEWQFCEEKRQS